MSKTVSANLQVHIEQEVTTLASLWKIVRTDAVEEYYTDHDQEITYDGDSYSPVNSTFSETAIKTDSGMSVDNLEIDLLLGGVDRDDILAGVYDFAEIYFSIINYQTPADGVIKMRRGYFGEVTLHRGSIRAELRGMMELLQHPMIQSYSPTCRADVFDTACGLNSATYKETGTTDNPVSTRIFDESVGSGLPSGFTHRLNGAGTYDIIADIYTNNAFGGNLLQTAVTFWTNTDANDMQFLSVDKCDGFSDTHIIAKVVDYNSRWHDNTFSVGCRVGGSVGSLDGYFLITWDSPVAVKKIGLYKAVAGTWTYLAGGEALNKPDNEDMYFELRVNGSDIKARWWYSDEAQPSAWNYEETDTDITAAGWTGVGNMREACWDFVSVAVAGVVAPDEIDTGAGNHRYFYDLDRSEANDYFNNGVVAFTSGDNDGFSVEVKDYNSTTKKIELWEPMPNAVAPGVTYEIWPGCDKTLATCRDTYDNVLNFRGEPHLPGQDVINQTPNLSERE